MHHPLLTVVIPTRDRPDKLLATLSALEQQKGHDGGDLEFEIVVVDDGSKVDLEPALTGNAASVRLLRQPSRGPAAARNRGVEAARAPRVLFLGDDTRPAPHALAEHLAMAARHDGSSGGSVGVQGRIDWDPDQPISDLMRFLAPEGPQFYFKGLENGREIPFTAVLGSNFSAPTEWLRREPFDEGFPHAAVEDTELAWRWQRRGWRTLYARDAVCLHDHFYGSLESFLRRQERAGRSARYAVRRHPRLLWKLAAEPSLYGVLIRLRGLLGKARAHDDWDLACRSAFLRGFRSRR